MLSRWRSSLRSWWHRGQLEEELDEELRFHMEARAEDLRRQGVPVEEARRRARLELGAVDGYKQEIRRERGLGWLVDLLADLHFALRSWRRHRALALAVTVVLTLGIGLSTAIFTLVNAVALRPQVTSDPGSFVKVFVAHAREPKVPSSFDPPELEDLLVLQRASRSLAAVAGARWVSGRLGLEPTNVKGLLVTCNFFSVYPPARPVIGRLLDAHDCAAGAPVMVLSEALWRQRGADPALVGQTLTYQGHPFRVVGVVAGRFDGVREENGIWIPHNHSELWPVRHRWELRFETGGRLRPGYSRRDATAELTVLMQQTDALHPGRRSRAVVTDGSVVSRPSDGDGLLAVSLLLGIPVMLVLLVSANAVTLLLARAHSRRQEIAVRLALGASRGRLMRMLAVETVPLAAVAAGLSVLLSHGLPPLVVAWLDDKPRDIPLHPDWRVWLFVAAVSFLAVLAAGLTPALESLNVQLTGALKGEHGNQGGESARPRRRIPLRELLIAGQIGICVVLLAGSGLFLRGYLRVSWGNPGFDSDRTLVATLSPRGEEPASWAAVHRAVQAELEATAGIESVSLAGMVPPGGEHLRVSVLGTGESRGSRAVMVNGISPGFFSTMGVPILRGRPLVAGDPVNDGAINVVVSERLARELLDDGDPLGATLRTSMDERFQVVGVAGDIHRPGRTLEPAIYRPLRDHSAVVLARFSGPPAAAVTSVQRAIARVDPRIHTSARTYSARYQKDAENLGNLTLLVLIPAAGAVLLALVGVYGTIAFSARRRLREIGIRLALGAQSGDVVRALVRPTARAVAAGLAVGLGLALLLAPGMRPLVGGLDHWDPVVYAGVSLVLILAAAAAMVRPARRALAADPARVLRDDG